MKMTNNSLLLSCRMTMLMMTSLKWLLLWSAPILFSSMTTSVVVVSAQQPTTNAVNISKSCYIPGEGLVVTFQDSQPQIRDWIGIIKASDNPQGSNVRYLQLVYTCGTNQCNGAAPTKGTVSIFNNLPSSQQQQYYKVVLLRSGTFNVLAVSSNSFRVAKTCPGGGGGTPTTNTIRVGKACYTAGEGVLATFTEIKPQVGDRVGLIQASVNVMGGGGAVSYPAVVFTCGTIGTCSTAPTRGTVSVFNSLSPGRYKAVLLQGSRLVPLAVSSNFVVANVCGSGGGGTNPTIPTPKAPAKKPIQAPTKITVRPVKAPSSSPVAPRANSIRVVKSCYQPQQSVVVTFVDVAAQVGDWIGLINSTAMVRSPTGSKYYPSVIFTCGTFTCKTAPTSGTVSLYQTLPTGTYKAVLLRGKQLIALAVSTVFTIASRCPNGA